MARASVEHDFFGIGDGGGCSKKPTMERMKSFREIHGEISRMSPDVIKSVIAASSSAAVEKTKTACGAATTPLPPPVPDSDSSSRHPKMETAAPAVAPLTIFYNGAVTVFELPQEKAEHILKLVEAEIIEAVGASSPTEPVASQEQDGGELPMARKMSLLRFLEKRQGKQNILEKPQLCML